MTDIKVLKPLDDEGHEAFLSIVERWLADRKEGPQKLAAIAIIAVHADGTVGSMYEGGDHYYPLLGGLVSLQHRMEKESYEGG